MDWEITIPILIATISCLIGLWGYIKTLKDDSGKIIGRITELETWSEHTDSSIKDMKDEIKLLRQLNQETHDKAALAETHAASAHERLKSIEEKDR